MEKEKLIEIVKDVENKSNKDLISSLEFLNGEYEKTKSIIIDLTLHMEKVESLYNKVNKELEKRTHK